jgi:hypothetical protein
VLLYHRDVAAPMVVFTGAVQNGHALADAGR